MELERRIVRLERENRRLKLAGVLALVAMGSLVLMGQGAAVSGQIKTRHFALVDSSDRPLVQIGPHGPGGAALILSDNSGAFEIALRVEKDGAELSLAGGKTGERIALEATGDERRLAIHQKSGVVADLGADAGASSLRLSGPAGEAVVRAGAEGPSVATTNAQGQPVWRRP